MYQKYSLLLKIFIDQMSGEWNHVFDKENNFHKIKNSKSFINLRNFRYPKTNIKISSNSLRAEYLLTNDKNQPDNNFSIEMNSKSLSIKTDYEAQFQIFFYANDNVIYASDNFSCLLDILPKKIVLNENIDQIHDYLLGSYDNSNSTILKEILILRENSELNISTNYCKLKPRYELSDLLKSSNYSNSFSEILDNDIQKLSSNSDYGLRIGSELSGGIDSAIVSERLLKIYNNSHLFSVILTAEQEEYQKRKILNFQNNFGGFTNFSYISNFNLYPKLIDLHNSEKIDSVDFNPYTDNYHKCFDQLSKIGAINNLDVVLSGFGADELFDYSPSKKNNNQNNLLLKPIRHNSKPPDERFSSIIPPALSHGYLFHPSIWRNNNIWNYSPYCTKEMIIFQLSSDENKLKNKQLLTKHLHVNNFPEIFLDHFRNETFSTYVIDETDIALKDIFLPLMSKSRIFELGLVNFDNLYHLVLNLDSLEIRIKKRNYSIINKITNLELFFQKYL